MEVEEKVSEERMSGGRISGGRMRADKVEMICVRTEK